MTHIPTDVEKHAVWSAYKQGHPIRVPVTLGANPRIILLDPSLNPEGWDFQRYFHDPRMTLVVQARFQEYQATTLSKVSDCDSALPDIWSFAVDNQNIYDAAYLGAKVEFRSGQVPGTRSPFTIADLDTFLATDFSDPFRNPWLSERLAFSQQLVEQAKNFTYLGRQGCIKPFPPDATEGPFTNLVSLFGYEALLLLAEDGKRASEAMFHITRAVIRRNQALADLQGGWHPLDKLGCADDAIQMISTADVETYVLPSLHLWYQEMGALDARRVMHLCGNATRHFSLLTDRLGVSSFDTGYPVDFGSLHRTLGPMVEILGGPPVPLLMQGSAEDCAAATSVILRSGIMEGGRFILREGNNLPPQAPLANLEAMYHTCLDEGKYE